MAKKIDLSVVIIARNEEQMIADSLRSALWAREIVVVDSGSSDKTVAIAKKFGAKVIKAPFEKIEFAHWRNLGKEATLGKWLIYLDADERVTPELKDEIIALLSNAGFAAYEIPRRNFYLGQEVHYGGAWPDYVKRLFLKEKLKRWERSLHEDPVFEGSLGRLTSPLIHITHRDLSSMLQKTNKWSEIEADLLYKAGHPPVTWWRVLRIMLGEFIDRGIWRQGLRDGTVGWIEVIFQVFSRCITYIKLWEKQNA